MLDLRKQTLLIVAPHPDDEVLGCGGLIQKVKDAGGKVYVLFLTVGQTIEYSKHGITTANERIQEVEKAAKYMQYDGYRIAFQGDSFHLRLDALPKKDIIYEIEGGKDISLNTIKPTIVATPPRNDYNQDHKTATDAVFAACRPSPNDVKPFQTIILGYESVSTAEWAIPEVSNHNFFLTLSEKELQKKIKALTLYSTQVREGNHPRSTQSMKSLAYFRGLSCGASAAEAYVLYRFVL